MALGQKGHLSHPRMTSLPPQLIRSLLIPLPLLGSVIAVSPCVPCQFQMYPIFYQRITNVTGFNSLLGFELRTWSPLSSH